MICTHCKGEFAQAAEAKQHHDRMAAEHGRHFQMSKTFFQPLLQVDPLKQSLKNQQTGKGCKLLIFKTYHWNFMEFCLNL